MTCTSQTTREIVFHSWKVRPRRREIAGPGGTVRVKPKSMDVLLALLRRPLQLRSRNELLAEVWKNTAVTDEVLTQSIAELRRAFGDDPKSPEVIATVPRAGYRLLVVPRTEPGESATNREAAAQLSPFVGRQRERDELFEALGRAEGGRGGIIFLSGEPGIGKTRLAEETLGMAHDRFLFALAGRCSEEAETPPLLPFVEIVERATRAMPREMFRSVLGESGPVIVRMVPGLRQSFPDLSPPPELPPEQQRRYLFNSFLEFLQRACELSSVCLVLDDLQWADDATAHLLHHLAPEAGRLRLLIVGAFRETELREASAIGRVMADLVRQRMSTRLALKALPADDVGQLLERLSGARPPEAVVDLIVRTTDGNPFFVEEMYSHSVETMDTNSPGGDWWRGLPLSESEVPGGVRMVTLQRARRLAGETQDFLSAAAVVGRVFDPELTRSMMGRVDRERFLSAVEEAELAGMVAPRESGRELRYEFTHDLIRHALLADLSELRRREMHTHVVECMEALYPEVDAYAAEVVSHLERGQAPQTRRRCSAIRSSQRKRPWRRPHPRTAPPPGAGHVSGK